VLGRSNVPARAADIDTWHPRYGRTTHPLDASLSPGGSSGGSAAAVAVGHTAFDIGSDDAGSARIPAHICGVFALRPTLGRLSPLGHVPGPLTEFDHSSSMLTVAPIARSAEDLSLIWRVLGPSARSPRPPARRPVAVALEDAGAPVSRQVTQSLHAAVGRLRRAGHEIVAARLPVDLAENWLLCQQLLYAENGEAGDGKTEAGPDRTGSAAPAAGAAPIDVAWWCAGLSHRAWRLLNRKRAESQVRWQRFFDRYSALLVPVMGVATLPPRNMDVPLVVDEVAIDGVEIPVFSLSAWCALASVAGLPAVSMPVASAGGGGFPVGLQVIAGHGQETALLELTERFAAALSPAPALRERP
jgi:amidase